MPDKNQDLQRVIQQRRSPLYILLACLALTAGPAAAQDTPVDTENFQPPPPLRAPILPNIAPAPSGLTPTYGSLSTLTNFRVVTAGILRGGQPTAQDLSKLKAAGVKTIIDLRNEEVLVHQEAQQARSVGLSFINIPLDVFNPPPEKFVHAFLHIVADPQNQPVYIHCLHGQDRTGTMVAIYRIERQGWSADQAYAEMLSCGFRPGFSNLACSVFAHGAAAGKPGTVPNGGDIVSDLKQRFRRSH